MRHGYTTPLKTVVFRASAVRSSDIQAAIHFSRDLHRTDHTYFVSTSFSRNTQAWAERTLQQQAHKRQANIQRVLTGNPFSNSSSELSRHRSLSCTSVRQSTTTRAEGDTRSISDGIDAKVEYWPSLLSSACVLPRTRKTTHQQHTEMQGHIRRLQDSLTESANSTTTQTHRTLAECLTRQQAFTLTGTALSNQI